MTNDSLNKLLDKTLDELCKMTPDEVFDFFYEKSESFRKYINKYISCKELK